MLKNEEEFNFTKTVKPNPLVQEDDDICKKRVKNYMSRKDQYEENKEKLYSIIWDQCIDVMQSKLQNKTTFQEIDKEIQCLNLLKKTKGVIFSFKSQQFLIMFMHIAYQKYFNSTQGKNESLNLHYKRSKTTVDVLEHYDANVCHHPGLILKRFHKDGGMNITLENMQLHREQYEEYGEEIK